MKLIDSVSKSKTFKKQTQPTPKIDVSSEKKRESKVFEPRQSMFVGQKPRNTLV